MGRSESLADSLRSEPLQGAEDLTQKWNKIDLLSLPDHEHTAYLAGFASSQRCVEEALRLRFEVFNLELGEGLGDSAVTGLDRDRFDDQMTHLVLIHKESGNIVGTYRLQTARHGLNTGGIYSAREFDLAAMDPYFDQAIEIGRACLAQNHRSLSAIIELWLGLGAFMNLYDQHFLFGCCSLTTQDPDDGWRAMKTIREKKYLHPDLFMPAREGFSCGAPSREFDTDLGEAVRLPKLFRTYMRLSAQVVSEPAIDREFGTVDFLVLMDGRRVNLSRLDVLK